jgi:F-type H+-transporting ATPase subunit delta
MASTAAYHFAASLLRSGRRAGDLAKVREDLGRVVRLIAGERLVAFFLMHPLIPAARKHEFLGLVSETETVRRLMSVLVETKNLALAGEIYSQFSVMARKDLGIVKAVVTTAGGLGADEEARLRQALAEHTGRQVDLEVRTDPGLLAGLRVKIGDKVIDNTLRRELKAVKERLVSS